MNRNDKPAAPAPRPEPGDTIEDLDRRRDSLGWLRLLFDRRDPPTEVKPLWQEIPPPPEPGDMIEDARKIDSFKRIRR